MKAVKFDFAYMYMYSERPKTLAERKFKDDVPEEVKMRRLQEIIDLQRLHSAKRNEMWVGKKVQVLIEGDSKKSKLHHFGKIDSNKVVVFPKKNEVKGDYVFVNVTHCTSGTLLGELC